MRLSRLVVGVLLAVLSVLSAKCAWAQNDPIFDTGMKPFASYSGGNIDTINLYNGELNLNIPLISYPQRGGKLKLDFHLRYADVGASQVEEEYVMPPPVYAIYYWEPISPFGATLPSTELPLAHGFWISDEQSKSVYSYPSALGNVVAQITASVWNADMSMFPLLPTSSSGTLWESIDGSAYQATSSSSDAMAPGVTLTGPDGVTDTATGRQDTNGNAITYSASAGWTDTMGREIRPYQARHLP